MSEQQSEETPQQFVPKMQPAVMAIRWTGDNWDAVSQWVYGTVRDFDDEDWDNADCPVVPDGRNLSVLEPDDNESYVAPGDWLIRDEFRGGWFMGDAEFEALYEPAPSVRGDT